MYIKGPYKHNNNHHKSYWLCLGMVILVIIPLACFSQGSAETSKARGTPSKKPLPQPMVIIDPGHGGSDPGACQGEVMEKDINLAIAKRLLTYVEPFQVRLTRERDMDFTNQGIYSKATERQDLDQRIQIAHQYKGDLFISIHVNSGVEKLRGPDVYYDPADSESSRLARLIQEEMNDLTDMKMKKPRQGKFYLFENLEIPVVIVETGWLCHAEDRKKLQDPTYQDQVAQAIGKGIERFFKEE
ncbi:N-acetylmuramoyl-L-alanine amidase family protein [Desulforamulus aeronauticus]|uniref:N-acetylmuramoyl-L-alanine amidase n=1 Tax=Desulforamulus aeronauticus DSM 10349 TaxID=1121421 RepID=A0A1M6TXE1_9FIRM|nr:N-acetylmuramoyl-L-alanine amidase [Desulforamulus aeronauticus]SHK61715.1 N-acetylmuramoyl-L-alanine amidase [Desulforamulus aeronauticus DSM 10349]